MVLWATLKKKNSVCLCRNPASRPQGPHQESDL